MYMRWYDMSTGHCISRVLLYLLCSSPMSWFLCAEVGKEFYSETNPGRKIGYPKIYSLILFPFERNCCLGYMSALDNPTSKRHPIISHLLSHRLPWTTTVFSASCTVSVISRVFLLCQHEYESTRPKMALGPVICILDDFALLLSSKTIQDYSKLSICYPPSAPEISSKGAF